MTTTPTEIAARAAIAIRIGTSGEEPPSDDDEDEGELLTGFADCTEPDFGPPVVALPGLPWPVPVPVPVLGLGFDDEPPDPEPPPPVPVPPPVCEPPDSGLVDFSAFGSALCC